MKQRAGVLIFRDYRPILPVSRVRSFHYGPYIIFGNLSRAATPSLPENRRNEYRTHGFSTRLPESMVLLPLFVPFVPESGYRPTPETAKETGPCTAQIPVSSLLGKTLGNGARHLS